MTKISPRSEVLWFANRMEEKLRANDARGGWNRDATTHLMLRMYTQFADLKEAVEKQDHKAAISEAADIANFAMMIADNILKQHMWNTTEEKVTKE